MPTLIIEHSDLTGADRLGEVLRDRGHRLNIVRLHRGDALPNDLDEVDAVITCGGPQDPCDDSVEWMSGQLDLLRRADALQMPVVGICLGSQLLARALGGSVAKIPDRQFPDGLLGPEAMLLLFLAAVRVGYLSGRESLMLETVRELILALGLAEALIRAQRFGLEEEQLVLAMQALVHMGMSRLCPFRCPSPGRSAGSPCR